MHSVYIRRSGNSLLLCRQSTSLFIVHMRQQLRGMSERAYLRVCGGAGEAQPGTEEQCLLHRCGRRVNVCSANSHAIKAGMLFQGPMHPLRHVVEPCLAGGTFR